MLGSGVLAFSGSTNTWPTSIRLTLVILFAWAMSSIVVENLRARRPSASPACTT